MSDPLTECRALLARGGTLEEAISQLKASGLSKVESIGILSTAAHLNLVDAKKAVHLSEAWREERQAGDELHEAIDRAISEEDGPGGRRRE